MSVEQNKIIPFAIQPREDSFLLQICDLLSHLVTSHLEPAMPEIPDKLTAFIDQQMESALNNQDIMRLMEAKTSLHKYGTEITSDFLTNITGSAPDQNIPQAKDSESVFSLMANDELDHKLAWLSAADQMPGKMNSLYLFNITQRFSKAFPDYSATIPSTAEHICECFSQALTKIETSTDIEQKLLFYFTELIGSEVSALWKEADQLLENTGLTLPIKHAPFSDSIHLKSTSKETLNLESTDQSVSSTPHCFSDKKNSTANSPAPSSFSASQDNSFMDSLAENLLSRVENILSRDGISTTDSQQVKAIDLADVLSTIQVEIHHQHNSIHDLTESIKSVLVSRGSNNTLSRRHEDLITLVGMLFEYILNDRQLPDDVKKLIALLQIPVLKQAILDYSFLTDRNHPGRVILNEMTCAGMLFTGEPKLRKPVLLLIENTVRQIISASNQNSEVFHESLSRFRFQLEELQKQETDPEKIELSSREVKQKVDYLLTDLTREVIVPEPIHELLFDGIRPSMITALQSGDELSAHWAERVDMIKTLVRSLQEPNQLCDSDLNSLYLQLQEILEQSEINSDVASEWMTALKNFHRVLDEIVLESHLTKPEQEQEYLQETSATPSEEDTENEQSESEIQKYFPVKGLYAGQWVEVIGEGESHRLRCKLDSINKVTDHYIFVNQSGMKIADWAGDQLKIEIEKGTVEIIEGHQIFDRALHAVMGKFKKV